MAEAGFTSSHEAETAFYEAMERADLGMMMDVWADSPDIICTHPMRGGLRGRAAVEQSWAAIFSQGSVMRFKLLDQRSHIVGDTAIHTLYESLTHAGDTGPPLMATNIYQRFADGWHIILHHASPCANIELSPPEQTLH